MSFETNSDPEQGCMSIDSEASLPGTAEPLEWEKVVSVQVKTNG